MSNRTQGHTKEVKQETYLEVEPAWKKRLSAAWGGVRKITSSGVKKSEKWSKIARHQVRRGILVRNRDKLILELGELTYQLLSDRRLNHEDLERSFERIQSISRNIDDEAQKIESLKQEDQES